jgi:glycosyltransferase involved in cell wall biosynthesis
MNIVELQKAMATVDINVVPLQHNDFTHSKSELKFFEAAIVGTPTIASAAPVFSAVIEHGVNGLLVIDHDWDTAFTAVSSMTTEQRAAMGSKAKKTAQRLFSPAAMAQPIGQAFGLK